MKNCAWFIVFILLFSLPACSKVDSNAITITDGLDRKVSLAKPAQKIISLAPSNTEILYAIGAGDRVIGRDDVSDYPAEVLDLPSVGGFAGYDLELITSLQPDLILAAEIQSPEFVKSIEELGITIYYLKNPSDFSGLYQNILTVGNLTAHVDEAQSLVDSLQKRVQAVENLVSSATSTPKVFYEIDASDASKPWTVGPGTYHDTLIRMAKAENIASKAESTYPQLSLEEVILQNPDYILLADALWGVSKDQVASRPGWETIKAVQDGNILPFDGNLLDRAGPRLVDGLEALVRILHPELF